MNIQNNNQETALMFAAQTGNLNHVDILISAGAEVKNENEIQEMLLIIECLNELIPAKVNQQGEEGNTAPSTFTDASLGVVAARGGFNYMTQSIALGADVNAWYNMSSRLIAPVVDEECPNKKDHTTPLMTVAVEGNVECLKEIIAVGVDINKEERWSNSFDDCCMSRSC